MIPSVPATSSTLTMGRARQSFVSVLSAEEARRIDRLALLSRQTYLRNLLSKTGFYISPNNHVELIFFSLLEQTGPELAACELSWALKCLGKDVKKNMLRKYVAGQRLVKRELSEGVWRLLLIPLFSQMGCSSSPDGTTIGMTSGICINIFSFVEISLSGLIKDGKEIRLAKSQMIEVTKKRANIWFYFWCEREQADGSFILR